MPKCYGCKRPVSGDQLRAFGENNRGWPVDELGCSECRRKRLTHLVSVPKKEVTMSKDRKAIASIQIFPNEMEDDYDIEGFVRVGGVKIEIDTNMNRVRDFFTKRKARRDREARAAKYKKDPSKAIPVEERC